MPEKIDINKFISERLQPMTKMIVQAKVTPKAFMIGLPIGFIIAYALFLVKIALVLFVIDKLGFWFGAMFVMVFGVFWRALTRQRAIKEELAFLNEERKF